MFEKATRLALRFATATQGLVSTEDLWNLPLTAAAGKTSLDQVAVALFKQLKSGDDVSFVTTTKKSDAVTQLKFDIVKHIIDVRVAEAEENAKKKANADKKQQLLGLIASKEVQALEGKSVEELTAMVNAL
jgi:hypothetical protein